VDLSPRERLVIIGVAIIAITPSLTAWIAIPMLIIGVALLLLAIFPINMGSWRSFIYGFVPLQVAARIAYEENQNNLSDGFAEHEFTGEADPISWYATALIGSNIDETGVYIFGCKPQLDILNEIPRQEVYRYHLVVNENEALLQDGISKNVKYDRLHVRKSEMKKRIKEISTTLIRIRTAIKTLK